VPPPDFISLLSDAESLQLMLFACPDGVLATDRNERVVLYTGACETLFGFAPIEAMGQPASQLFASDAGYERFRERLEEDGMVSSMELSGARKDGPPFLAAISAALLRDRDGSAMGTVIYVRDHTDVRGIEDELRDNNRRLNDMVGRLNHAATHDQLTGMLYRGSAIETAEATMLASDLLASQFGVALFDLDHFKAVNDSYGHLVGDQVLSSLAATIRQVARQHDIVGRFGGEEFIAFLPGASLEAVRGFAERVLAAVAGHRVELGDGVGISITISAGVAAIPDCADNLTDAIRVADDRLLAAKRAGRNRVTWQDTTEERNAA
jgi:diguanylate cyclase (GGDEF)-like protein/PAS domain S-box-containing protein